MSFQLAATAAKPNEVRKALEAQRDQRLKSEELNANRANGVDDVQPLRDELEGDLVDAAIAAAEAGIRKLKGAGSYQVTVMGGQDPGDPASQDATAPTNQHFSVSVRAF